MRPRATLATRAPWRLAAEERDRETSSPTFVKRKSVGNAYSPLATYPRLKVRHVIAAGRPGHRWPPSRFHRPDEAGLALGWQRPDRAGTLSRRSSAGRRADPSHIVRAAVANELHSFGEHRRPTTALQPRAVAETLCHFRHSLRYGKCVYPYSHDITSAYNRQCCRLSVGSVESVLYLPTSILGRNGARGTRNSIYL